MFPDSSARWGRKGLDWRPSAKTVALAAKPKSQTKFAFRPVQVVFIASARRFEDALRCPSGVLSRSGSWWPKSPEQDRRGPIHDPFESGACRLSPAGQGSRRLPFSLRLTIPQPEASDAGPRRNGESHGERRKEIPCAALPLRQNHGAPQTSAASHLRRRRPRRVGRSAVAGVLARDAAGIVMGLVRGLQSGQETGHLKRAHSRGTESSRVH
jgi:hypothetical protein